MSRKQRGKLRELLGKGRKSQGPWLEKVLGAFCKKVNVSFTDKLPTQFFV